MPASSTTSSPPYTVLTQFEFQLGRLQLQAFTLIVAGSSTGTKTEKFLPNKSARHHSSPVQGDGNRQRRIAAANVDEETLPVAGWFDLAGARDHGKETLWHAGAKTAFGRDPHGHQCAVDR